MKYSIIQTNTVTKHWQGFDQDTRESIQLSKTFPPGRIIAEHNSLDTVEKHCQKLKRCHPDIEFTIKETEQPKHYIELSHSAPFKGNIG